MGISRGLAAVLIGVLCCMGPLDGCTRAAPTAARWKVHVGPASGETTELSINIAAPDQGYAYSRREDGTGFIVEVRRADRLVFTAGVSEQSRGSTYRLTVHNSSGAPAVITAGSGLTLLRDGQPLENNRGNLSGRTQEAILLVQRREVP